MGDRRSSAWSSDERLPSLAEYYRDGLRVVVEPGTAFAYSNHGYATLGQIVEDVSGMPLERYFRERIFEPLGMADSDLVRSDRVASRLATGYVLGRRGAKAVPDRDWIGAGAGGIYSTSRDLARFVAALLGGGANEHGRVLEPATLATMFEPHYQPDAAAAGHGPRLLPRRGRRPPPRLPRRDPAGLQLGAPGGPRRRDRRHRPHERLPRSASPGCRSSSGGCCGELLGLPEDALRSDVPHHPEVWAELCGRYVFPPRIADLRQRLMLGGGAEVFVRGGRLMVRLLTPVPALYRGLPLHPDDPTDPYVFRLDLSTVRDGVGPGRVRRCRRRSGDRDPHRSRWSAAGR